MDVDKFKQQIKKILADDLGQALLGLEQKIKPHTISYDDLIILRARYSKMKRNEMHGILVEKELDVIYSSLTKAVIDYINALPFSDLIDSNADISEVIKTKSIFVENEITIGKLTKEFSSELERLFTIDLHSIPNESFYKLGGSKNVSGQNVYLFEKKLDVPELGIFNELQVNLIAGRTRNIFFYNRNPDVVNPNKIKNLINTLYGILGEDDDGKGFFTPQDLEDYNSETLYVLFGRNWREFPKNRNPVALVRFDDHVSLGIWGIDI